jgi:hypothetical protein
MKFTEGSKTSEYKIEYEPCDQIPDLQFLKNMASSFHSAAHRCRIENVSPDGKSDMPGIPMVVNLAFSAELYLKYLIRKYQIQVTDKQFKTHFLCNLFSFFTPEFKHKIIEVANYSDVEFMRLLEMHNDMFNTWRYAFEKDKPVISEVGFMDNLVYALGVLADQE